MLIFYNRQRSQACSANLISSSNHATKQEGAVCFLIGAVVSKVMRRTKHADGERRHCMLVCFRCQVQGRSKSQPTSRKKKSSQLRTRHSFRFRASVFLQGNGTEMNQGDTHHPKKLRDCSQHSAAITMSLLRKQKLGKIESKRMNQ